MFSMTKTNVRRTKRTDQIILLNSSYTGNLDSPKDYNTAFANALQSLADKIKTVSDAWVDPEIVVWMQFPGRIIAEARFSPLVKKKGK